MSIPLERLDMGGCVCCNRRLFRVWGIALMLSLMAAINLNLILGTAIAGTENGEFCPTCPDWTDLDGWLVKKDAYEKAQINSMQHNGQSSSTSTASAQTEERSKGYPHQELLSYATASRDEMVVLDVRTPQDYKSGHIPGARSLYWKGLQKDGCLDPEGAESALRRAGVNNSDRLLIYGGPDEGPAFVFWALNYLGQENVSLLDGGIDAAWSAGILPDRTEASAPVSNYTKHTVPWLLVTPANLDSFLAMADVQILDARDFADFGMNRLTNASIPLTAENLYDDSKIRDAATLEELLNRRSLDKKGTQLVYGTPQAYSLFYALQLMGYNATLLEGDWWQETRWAVRNVR